MHTIVLIGAGNIGSRHLQGLALLKIPVTIFVVDPTEDSLKLAQTRFEEVNKNPEIKISYHSKLDFQLEKIDLALIATNSKIRKQVTESFVKSYQVKNIVFEKFLFQDLEDYKIVSDLLKKYAIQAWVNCPRRLYPAYMELKELLKTENRIEFHASGSNWGLGCNGIHFLDLYSFLTETVNLETSDALLDKEILSSKRDGYIEFTGSLIGKDENENTCLISSYKKEGRQMNITINTERYLIAIFEKGTDSKIVITDKKENFNTEVRNFSAPFQSQLTGSIAETILKEETCQLATYEESRLLHETVLKTFINFLQKQYNDKNIHSCPIT